MSRTTDKELKLSSRIGFREVVPGSNSHCLDTGIDAGVAGHKNDERAGRRGHYRLEHVDPRDRLEVNVDQHNVKARSVDHLDRFFAARCHLDVDPFGAQHARASFAQCSIVVDDEGSHFFRHGIVGGRL